MLSASLLNPSHAKCVAIRLIFFHSELLETFPVS